MNPENMSDNELIDAIFSALPETVSVNNPLAGKFHHAKQEILRRMGAWHSAKDSLPQMSEWKNDGAEDEPYRHRSSAVLPVISNWRIRFACLDEDSTGHKGWTDIETHGVIKVTHWYNLPMPNGVRPNRFGED